MKKSKTPGGPGAPKQKMLGGEHGKDGTGTAMPRVKKKANEDNSPSLLEASVGKVKSGWPQGGVEVRPTGGS